MPGSSISAASVKAASGNKNGKSNAGGTGNDAPPPRKGLLTQLESQERIRRLQANPVAADHFPTIDKPNKPPSESKDSLFAPPPPPVGNGDSLPESTGNGDSPPTSTGNGDSPHVSAKTKPPTPLTFKDTPHIAEKPTPSSMADHQSMEDLYAMIKQLKQQAQELLSKGDYATLQYICQEVQKLVETLSANDSNPVDLTLDPPQEAFGTPSNSSPHSIGTKLSSSSRKRRTRRNRQKRQTQHAKRSHDASHTGQSPPLKRSNAVGGGKQPSGEQAAAGTPVQAMEIDDMQESANSQETASPPRRLLLTVAPASTLQVALAKSGDDSAQETPQIHSTSSSNIGGTDKTVPSHLPPSPTQGMKEGHNTNDFPLNEDDDNTPTDSSAWEYRGEENSPPTKGNGHQVPQNHIVQEPKAQMKAAKPDKSFNRNKLYPCTYCGLYAKFSQRKLRMWFEDLEEGLELVNPYVMCLNCSKIEQAAKQALDKEVSQAKKTMNRNKSKNKQKKEALEAESKSKILACQQALKVTPKALNDYAMQKPSDRTRLRIMVEPLSSMSAERAEMLIQTEMDAHLFPQRAPREPKPTWECCKCKQKKETKQFRLKQQRLLEAGKIESMTCRLCCETRKGRGQKKEKKAKESATDIEH